jgi:hypothetical protein
MKNKATPTLHDNDQPNAALAGGNSGARQIFKLGLDVDLNNAVAAIQCGAGDIKRGAKLLPRTLARLGSEPGERWAHGPYRL